MGKSVKRGTELGVLPHSARAIGMVVVSLMPVYVSISALPVDEIKIVPSDDLTFIWVRGNFRKFANFCKKTNGWLEVFS